MWHRQAYGFACVIFAGTSEELAGPRALRELVVGVTVPSDLAGSFIVKILHIVEGRDIEQVCSNLKIILPCLRLLISLFLSHLCLCILHVYIVYLFICFIYLCFINIYAWVVCLLTLIFNQESHSGTSTLNLEKS